MNSKLYKFKYFPKKIFLYNGLLKIKKNDLMLKNKRDEVILQFLQKEFASTLKQVKEEKHKKNNHSSYVWTMWLQGEQAAPEIVQFCLQSIKNHLNEDLNLVILDEKNIHQYITIPKIIQKKYQKGLISPAHYSDIIRSIILKEYGGLWLDSTIFVNAQITKEYTNQDFNTIKNHSCDLLPFCKYRWVYFLIGGSNSLLFSYLYALLTAYWKKYDYAISYFLVDYFIEVARRFDNRVAQLLEENPENNQACFILEEYLEQPLNKQHIQEALENSSQQFYKLSHRNQINQETFAYLKQQSSKK